MFCSSKMYSILFNGITDALEQLEQINIGKAKEILIHAQQKTEEPYLSTDEKTKSADI